MKTIKNIPNGITLMNLLAGILSILFILSGDPVTGSLFIGIALVLDFLDGMFARLLDAQSPIGAELDSLADVVSFGVAPGFILWSVMRSPEMQPAGIDRDVIAYLSFVVPLFAAIRLARFNVDVTQRSTFSGLPTPATAIFIGSLPLIRLDAERFPILSDLVADPIILAAIALFLSFMMVAPVNLLSLKFTVLSWKANWNRYVLFAFAVVMIVLYHVGAFPVIVLFYILLSLCTIPQHGRTRS